MPAPTRSGSSRDLLARHSAPDAPIAQPTPVNSERDQALWQGNLHIYFSTIQFESRILKITRSLVDKGIVARVHILGLWEPNLPETQTLDEHRTIHRIRLRCPRRRGSFLFRILRSLEFSIRAIFYARKKDIQLVNCHMLMGLPVCVLLKYLLHTQLVYDAHEIETEAIGVEGLKKRFLQRFEISLLRHVDLFVQAGRSYAQWYEEHYKVRKVHVLNNVPYASGFRGVQRTQVFNQCFGIPSEHMIFIYQGWLNEERGIEMLLRVFENSADETKHVVFMGYGDLQGEIERAAAKLRTIHYHGAVPPSAIKDYTSGADVGLSLPLNASVNNYLCNPNKTYEYLLSGVPMIVSDFPELIRFVSENKCGWVVEPTEETVAELVGRLSGEQVDQMRRNLEPFRWKHGWEQEEKVLESMYKELAAKKR